MRFSVIMPRLLEEKKIEVRKQLPDQLIGSVFAGDFLQLLSNLIRNAAEALSPGGTLCLRLKTAGTNALITVSDNGKGIPFQLRKRLFEAFQSDKGDDGNGLGLWICKQIVDKHQGRIHWRSATGGRNQGTTFLVSLPLESLPTETLTFANLKLDDAPAA